MFYNLTTSCIHLRLPSFLPSYSRVGLDMRTSSTASDPKRPANIVVMIFCVALIPFLVTRSDFLEGFTQITYILLAASFSPWIVWWKQVSKLLLNESSERNATATMALLLMLVTCVGCNSMLLWFIFMSCMRLEIFPINDYGIWILLSALAPFTIGLMLMLQVTRRVFRKSSTPQIREALLLWLGLVLPILGVLCGSLVIYEHGTLQLYEWFFAQSLGYGAAFYALTKLDDKANLQTT